MFSTKHLFCSVLYIHTAALIFISFASVDTGLVHRAVYLFRSQLLLATNNKKFTYRHSVLAHLLY